MLKNGVLVLAIFLSILLALTLGETAFHRLFGWVSTITDLLIRNFGDLFAVLWNYLRDHVDRVILAAVLTLPVSLWALRSQRDTLGKPRTQRRIAIVLAIFLGWLGAHRFFLGQIGWGLGFLVVAYLLPPLALALALIDAIRYLFMDDETFALTQLS